MNQSIRVLHLEDDPSDAELIQRKLKTEGFACDIVVANAKEKFESALAETEFDLMLTDYNLRDYDGMAALKLARTKQPATPVIVISGTLSEEEAVECLKAGATDYVLKHRLQRLGAAVTRALNETEEHRRRQQAEEALRISESRLKLALEASDVAVWDYDIASGEVYFLRHMGPILGYGEAEVPARIEAWEALTHTEDLALLREDLARHYRGETPLLDVEYRMRAKDGEWRWLHTVGRTVTRDAATGRATHMTGTHRDVTKRRRSEELLRLQELAINSATNAILISDARAPDQPLVHVNPAFERMTGYSANEITGRNCRFLQGEDRDQPEIDRLRAATQSGSPARVLLRNYRKDGTLFWNDLQISPVRDKSGVVTHFIGIQNDVTEIKNYQAELEHRANHDTLTGIANRNLLNDRLERAILFARRLRQKVAVLFLDLDRFKIVNDSLGHESGDALLKIVAERLKNCVRQGDTVARIGGDEFVVLLSELEMATDAARIAQKVIDSLAEPITILSNNLSASASIGISIYPDDGQDAESLLKNADVAMYRAKQSGPGQYSLYTRDMNARALELFKLESDLRNALDRHEFELHYQPRVELASGRVTSVEALIRWRRGEQGLISPAHFIPLAEETGLIVPIGEWVLRTACAQMRRWRDDGYDGMRMAVNLSPRQFKQPDLFEKIGAILAESELDARHLELEITESMAMQDPKRTQELLARLSTFGIALAIDDFGTGYSSLAYLKRFPIDYLKIDQSFVRGLPGDEDDAHIVRAIIALGKSLKLVLIAEGVETEQQLDFMRAEGCDEMQGYLFSKPRPAAEIAGLLGGSRL